MFPFEEKDHIIKLIFLQEKEAGFKIMNLLFALYAFLGTLEVITGFDGIIFDTSYYKVLVDQSGGNFDYWYDRCRGELKFKI